MAARPVLIAGAGIAGLTLALALARKGRSSRLLERRNELSESGAGIQLGPNAMQVLTRLGVAPLLEPLAGQPQSILVYDGASGRELAALPLGDAIADRFGAPYRVAHRADLQGALLTCVQREPAISLMTSFEVAAWEASEGGVRVRSAAGQIEDGAALVGADGVWSGVRRAMFPDHPLTYAGKLAVRTIILAPPVGSRFALPSTGVWLSRDAHVVHYPIRGGREIAVVAIVDEPSPRDGWGGKIESDVVLQRLSGFTLELREFLRQAWNWRGWSLYDPAPLPAWSRGRVGLIGDAAHPILPFLAQGGAMAIEDAETLAALLAALPDDPGAAFVKVETLRRARVARVQVASRANGRIFHLHGAAGFARNAALGVVPGSLMMSRYDWLYGWNGDAVLSVLT